MKNYSSYLLMYILSVLIAMYAFFTNNLLVGWINILAADIFIVAHYLSIQIDELKNNHN